MRQVRGGLLRCANFAKSIEHPTTGFRRIEPTPQARQVRDRGLDPGAANSSSTRLGRDRGFQVS